LKAMGKDKAKNRFKTAGLIFSKGRRKNGFWPWRNEDCG